jgi:transposase
VAAVIARRPGCLEAEEPAAVPGDKTGAPTPPMEPADRPTRPLSANQQARHAAVRELHARGLTISAIARALALDRKTVRRYADAAAAAAARPPARRRRTLLDAFLDELHRRWADGCRNARRLFAEIRARGYRGSYSTVRAYLARLRDGRPPPRRRLATVREVVRLILRRPEEVDAAGRTVLERVVGRDAELTVACRRAQAFAALLRERRGDELGAWVEAVLVSGIAELAAFAAGLRKDWAAVVAGLTVEWSSGQVEGQVNRVKLLKKQGYGRAKIDLLRKRILLAG